MKLWQEATLGQFRTLSRHKKTSAMLAWVAVIQRINLGDKLLSQQINICLEYLVVKI